MQRILSVETSRSSNLTSEFVTKRLCCSFILTVAFFAVIGGFFLGRFATEKTLQKLKMEISGISKKTITLDKTLKYRLNDSISNSNCSDFTSKVLNCEHFRFSPESSTKSVQDLLDGIISCFNYG